MGCKEHSDIETYGVAGQRGCVECSSTKSLDTPTIDEGQTLDEMLNKFADSGCMLHSLQEKAVKKAKQALLQWHNSKVLDVIGDEKSFERMFDGKAIVFEKDGMQYPAIPLYTAVMTLKRYRRAIDQTLKAIEESK